MTITKSDKSPYAVLTWIPTGFGKLDTILGGGIPTRKITEISGKYSVGKTTLALQIVAQAQKEDMDCLWADAEWSYDALYATKMGVEVANLDLLQERVAEGILDGIQTWCSSHHDALIVLDSVGGLLPRDEAEKGSGGKVIGGQARLIAAFCRKMTGLLAENNNALIVLNHEFLDLFGKLKTSGGIKLEYAKAIWLMLRPKGERIMKGEDQVGMKMVAEIRKNKLVATVKQDCDLTMMFGEGFSAEQDKVEELLTSGELEKKGRTFYYKGEKVAGSMADAREWVKNHEEAAS